MALIKPQSEGVSARWFDFASSGKPHLLTQVDNGLGSLVTIRYSTSTQEYLRDRQADNPWQSRVPVPAEVVSHVETQDRVTGNHLQSRYHYHEGFYDTFERQFNGFGYVEQFDAESVETEVGQDQAPVHRKVWHHTGAVNESGQLSAHYQHQYYRGDNQAAQLPDSSLDEAIVSAGDKTLREAFSALKGRVLRQEIYAQDGSKQEADPYQISGKNYQIRLLQGAVGDDADNGFGSFFIHALESLAYDYERDPADPRIHHQLTLSVDAYGNITRSASIAYPRRARVQDEDPVSRLYAEQSVRRISVQEAVFFNQDDDSTFLSGLNVAGKSWEINGSPTPDATDSRDAVHAYSAAADFVQDALDNTTAYGAEFSGELQSRLIQANRNYYWDRDRRGALALGQVISPPLLHHREAAVYTPELIESVYGDRVTDVMLQDNGYHLQDRIWWTRGSVNYFEDARGYYLPYRVTDNFGRDEQVRYDPYYLFPVERLILTVDPYTNSRATLSSKADIDYFSGQFKRITDANSNITEALYDPFGRLIVTTFHGATKYKDEEQT